MKRIQLTPAIDIREGRCVRLLQGDFSREERYEADPVELAQRYEQAGFERLHLVDLDGARQGRFQNHDLLSRILERTRLRVDVSGGIKSKEQASELLEAGAAFVTLGSSAVRDPEGTAALIDSRGADRVILAADIRNERIAIGGWEEDSGLALSPFVEHWSGKGIERFLVTDIQKDGSMEGPGMALYKKCLSERPDLHWIASGGVRSVTDIEALEALGMSEVVLGKALLNGAIDAEQLRSKGLLP